MSLHRGHPDDVALLTPDEKLSYADLDSLVAQKIERFRQAGIGAGHRIAMYEVTSIDYIVSVIALIERGVVVCPMSTRWPETTVSKSISSIHAVLLQDVLARGHNTQSIEASHILTDQRWATVVFTSGSTGTPKAAVHSLANHRASAQASNQNIALEPGDRWLLSLPLYHVGGLGILFRCLEAGATIALPHNGQSIQDSIASLKPSHVSLVSTMLYRMLKDDASKEYLSTMKAVLMGGSALSSQLIHQAIDAEIALYSSYGMTEMTTQISCTRAESTISELLTSGKPLLPTSILIDEENEICVSGPCLFQGYLEGDSLYLPLSEDGFFATGDTGYIDDDGFLNVTGRLDRMFISGGENIQPGIIEQALCQLDGIVQSLVFPIEDLEFGQRPVALVRHEGELDSETLRETLRSSLPGFMVPVLIRSWPEELDEGLKPNVNTLLELWGKSSKE